MALGTNFIKFRRKFRFAIFLKTRIKRFRLPHKFKLIRFALNVIGWRTNVRNGFSQNVINCKLGKNLLCITCSCPKKHYLRKPATISITNQDKLLQFSGFFKTHLIQLALKTKIKTKKLRDQKHNKNFWYNKAEG